MIQLRLDSRRRKKMAAALPGPPPNATSAWKNQSDVHHTTTCRCSQPPRLVAGESTIVHLALIRPGDMVDRAAYAAVAAWERARRAPGAAPARCAACGVQFDSSPLLAIALRNDLIYGDLCLAGICRECAQLSDEHLFAAMRARLGGRGIAASPIAASALSATVGCA
jgi:hypothetical protein